MTLRAFLNALAIAAIVSALGGAPIIAMLLALYAICAAFGLLFTIGREVRKAVRDG